MTSANAGTLYIVATPIGNLSDITQRAIDTLKKVDCIAAEDTRHTRQLMSALGIQNDTIALHEHNERERASFLIKRLTAGEHIALVSDAGTPLISDPGYHLVNQARTAGINVSPIPGPSALITALSVMGLPTDRFSFEGFLPAKAGARLNALQALRTEHRTLVFYESCHRIDGMIGALNEVFGADHPAAIAREITKKFEQVVHAPLGQLLAHVTDGTIPHKGEFVVAIAGNAQQNTDTTDINTQQLLTILLRELPVKQAAKLAANITGEAKNDLYQQALSLKDAL